MGTIHFPCGCWISRSMYGNREIKSLQHCEDHSHLFSENKTLRQMADEMFETDKTKDNTIDESHE